MRAMIGVVLALACSACGTVSYVNGISASPDGKTVTVVGAQFRKSAFGQPSPEKPIRWECRRGGDDKLTCSHDTAELPRL